MDNRYASHELQARYDRPADADYHASEIECGMPPACLPTRGVWWVMQWAAAAVVLVLAASTLAEFCCLAAAERSLNFAARAGALEATLPRATYGSVLAAAKRRLSGFSRMQNQVQLTLLCDGQPVGRNLAISDGVRLSVLVNAPAAAVLPAWLSRLTPWRSEQPVVAQANRVVPGRRLRRPQS